jgi:26S proteasome regulatory subunit N9
MVRDVSKYLRTKEGMCDGEMAAHWAKLDDLYSKRLWHQVTLALEEFLLRPELHSGTQLIDLYDNFIQDIEMR